MLAWLRRPQFHKVGVACVEYATVVKGCPATYSRSGRQRWVDIEAPKFAVGLRGTLSGNEVYEVLYSRCIMVFMLCEYLC